MPAPASAPPLPSLTRPGPRPGGGARGPAGARQARLRAHRGADSRPADLVRPGRIRARFSPRQRPETLRWRSRRSQPRSRWPFRTDTRAGSGWPVAGEPPRVTCKCPGTSRPACRWNTWQASGNDQICDEGREAQYSGRRRSILGAFGLGEPVPRSRAFVAVAVLAVVVLGGVVMIVGGMTVAVTRRAPSARGAQRACRSARPVRPSRAHQAARRPALRCVTRSGWRWPAACTWCRTTNGAPVPGSAWPSAAPAVSP
jgi:hypothetical protein